MSQALSIGVRGTICIAWIDESYLTRECLSLAIASARPSLVIAPFESVYDCLKVADRQIDVIVYHAHETGAVTHADIVALRQALASTPLVVLSDASSPAPATIKEALTQGIAGFVLTRETGLQMLVSALALVAAGGTFAPKEYLLSESNTKKPFATEKSRPLVRLSAKELEVLALLKQGKANKTIAHDLHLSESNVKVRIRTLMRKLGSTNRTHLAMNVDRYLETRAA
jgi:DNA-binding NarL/FixJ family response regulator